MGKSVSFSVYRIEKEIDGQPVVDFNNVVKEPEKLDRIDLPDGFGFAARLFVAPPKVSQPPWRAFLEPAFGTLDQVSESVANSAVLVARIDYDDQDCYFALPFGFGRYLLKANCCTWNYGLRVALNAMYPFNAPDNGHDPARVRSVDSKTISSNVIYTRRQMARQAIFDDFGFNIQADQLKSITGAPVDDTQWGTRLTGANVLHLSPKIMIHELGPLLVKIEETYRQPNNEFQWIDNIRAVTDEALIRTLDNKLPEKVLNDDELQVSLTAPHIIDWGKIDTFKYSVPHEIERDDLDIADYRDCLKELVKEDPSFMLTAPMLRMHTIEALDGGGLTKYRWSAYQCLYAEIEHNDGRTYLLEGGNYYVISSAYLEELNGYLEALEEADIDLPTTTKCEDEGTYNEKVAQYSPDYLLLDKKTVRVKNKTSPIEICDILTSKGQFIHVKRKLSSSSLSHLFGQGYVSSELLRTNQEYRQAVLDTIKCAEEESGDSDCQGRFKVIKSEGIQPSNYQVVYAIAAPWNGRSVAQALPFFSKVNLRHYANDLQRLGFKVAYKRVEALAA